MTEEQISVAESYEDYHYKKFNYKKPNTMFVRGNIEDLKSCGIKDNSIDVVISNCVINLASNKEAVFREIYRVLKPYGQLYFSDIYSNKRISNTLKQDKVLYGECLSGALYKQDFATILNKVGFTYYQTVTSRILNISDTNINKLIGHVTFYSETISTFKIPNSSNNSKVNNTSSSNNITSILGLEDSLEDYQQYAIYNGTLPNYPHGYSISIYEPFITNVKTPIHGNTALILNNTRYKQLFQIINSDNNNTSSNRDSYHQGKFIYNNNGTFVIPPNTSMVDTDNTTSSACCVGGSNTSNSNSGCCPPTSSSSSGSVKCCP